MGMDMSMFIVKDKHILADDIFEGRNSDWFRQMQGHCCGENDEFAHLHPYYNFEANGHTPDRLLKQYTEPLEDDDNQIYAKGVAMPDKRHSDPKKLIFTLLRSGRGKGGYYSSSCSASASASSSERSL